MSMVFIGRQMLDLRDNNLVIPSCPLSTIVELYIKNSVMNYFYTYGLGPEGAIT
jgi:hypothetical protein